MAGVGDCGVVVDGDDGGGDVGRGWLPGKGRAGKPATCLMRPRHLLRAAEGLGGLGGGLRGYLRAGWRVQGMCATCCACALLPAEGHARLFAHPPSTRAPADVCCASPVPVSAGPPTHMRARARWRFVGRRCTRPSPTGACTTSSSSTCEHCALRCLRMRRHCTCPCHVPC